MRKTKSLEEVEIEFRNSIEIPKIKNTQQIFFCPVGLVGAGKTTVTKPISRELNLLRVSSDELRKILKENNHSYDPIADIGSKTVNDFAEQGYSIAFDMDCGNPKTKSWIETLAKRLNTEAFFVHITAPEEFIFNKFRNHPPSWLANDPQVMIDNYLEQKRVRMKENTKFNFFYVFDTSKSDIKGQIEDCINLIKSDAGLG